jgi:hypothetical protein
MTLNAKIKRISSEIEKARGKNAEQQARLRDLEKKKTEIENLEIVTAVRGMNISFADLAELLKQVKPNSLSDLATSSQTGGRGEQQAELATSHDPKLDTNNNEEDNK